MTKILALILAVQILSTSADTPAPGPGTNAQKNPKPNPLLFDKCCAPGRCNTDSPQAASDCSAFLDNNGDRQETENWATCQDQPGCGKAANSCGGYSGTDLVPGEWCSANSVAMVCCVPGNLDSGGCGKGDSFDSSDWLECKYDKGCTKVMNQCGGFETGGVWTKVSDLAAGKKGACPPGTGRAGDELACSTANAPGGKGLSGVIVAALVIGAVVVVGALVYVSNRSPPKQEEQDMQYQLEKSDATVEHNSL